MTDRDRMGGFVWVTKEPSEDIEQPMDPTPPSIQPVGVKGVDLVSEPRRCLQWVRTCAFHISSRT